MPLRPMAATALLLVLSACGGSAASGPPSTSATGAGASAPSGTSGVATDAAIDLSDVDACLLVDEGTVERLTGETGFLADGNSDPSSSTCFWAVPRPGVPQYLEVRIFRSKGLADYTLTVNGVACPAVDVPGIGSEAKGGVCTTPQRKVYLVAMDRGVAVQVIVNEPKGALTPADLAAAVNLVLGGIG